MTKDNERLPYLLGVAPLRLPGLSAEQIAALRKAGAISEQMKALEKKIRPFTEWSRRAQQESKLREQESELRIRIAHAQRQIETLQEEKKKAETELAAVIVARGAGGRTVDPASEPAQTVSPVPADSPPADPPTKVPHQDPMIRAALDRLYPRGVPATVLLKTATDAVNQLLADEARDSGQLTRKVSRDTISRALGRRKG